MIALSSRRPSPPVSGVSRPALRYFGGKWRLAPWIISHLPAHSTYVEPFGGAASVLLRKPPSRVEVYNDRNAVVVNFFRVLRDDGDALLHALEHTAFAADEYSEAREQAGSDLERARRFFIRSWGGFGGCSGATFEGRMRSTGWRRSATRNTAGQFASAVEALRATRERLRRVIVDNLSWRDVVDIYDSETTCFYVDPPYVLGSRGRTAPSDGYGANELTDEDHEELCDRLLSVRGAVVVSGYANPIYDRHLAGWERVERSAKTQSGSRVEVLWIRAVADCIREAASNG